MTDRISRNVARGNRRTRPARVQQHFVEFYSPGTFFAETSLLPIESWDVSKAVKMADDVVARYGATPWGFRFIARGRTAKDLDSKVIDKSPIYHLGGVIETLEQIASRGNENERILLSNMRANGWDRVVVNTNSWRSVQPLRQGEKVLDYTPPKRTIKGIS